MLCELRNELSFVLLKLDRSVKFAIVLLLLHLYNRSRALVVDLLDCGGLFCSFFLCKGPSLGFLFFFLLLGLRCSLRLGASLGLLLLQAPSLLFFLSLSPDTLLLFLLETLGFCGGLLTLTYSIHGRRVDNDRTLHLPLHQLAAVPGGFWLVATLAVLFKVQVDLWVRLDWRPRVNTLRLEPRLLFWLDEGQVDLHVFHVDGECDRVAHAEFQLRLVLNEHVQIVLNLEQLRVDGACEHLRHVSQLRVQKVNGGYFGLLRRHLKFNSSLVSDLLSAPRVLLRIQVLFNLQQGLGRAKFTREARDFPLQLDLVRLDGFLTSRIIHLNVHFDQLTRCVSVLFELNDRGGF